MLPVLASADDRTEDVRIGAVIIAELKLGDIQWQIFGAHFVECSDHAALEDRPEALNRVRVNRANHILMFAVVNAGVAIFVAQIPVARPAISRDQAHFIGNDLIHEIKCVCGIDGFEHAGDDVALALHCADDWRLLIVVALFSSPDGGLCLCRR
jgi:hypothetical protein